MEAQFGRQTGRIKLRALDALSLDKANHPLTTVLDCRENSRMDCDLLIIKLPPLMIPLRISPMVTAVRLSPINDAK